MLTEDEKVLARCADYFSDGSDYGYVDEGGRLRLCPVALVALDRGEKMYISDSGMVGFLCEIAPFHKEPTGINVVCDEVASWLGYGVDFGRYLRGLVELGPEIFKRGK